MLTQAHGGVQRNWGLPGVGEEVRCWAMSSLLPRTLNCLWLGSSPQDLLP